MPKGKPITEDDITLMLQLRERGKSNKEIADILSLSVDAVNYKIGTDKPKKESTNPSDLSAIERKLDNMPDIIVRKINEIIDIVPNANENILSLESVGYKATDQKTYVKKDGNQIKQIVFVSKEQISYVVKDENGKPIGRYYFNAQTLEAIFGAILDRGWNYFRK